MAINQGNHPYSKFTSPITPQSNLNVASGGVLIDHLSYYNVSNIEQDCLYCQNERFKWCNIHWKCCCCYIRLCICMIAFWIFLFLTLTFLLIIAYLGGYIFQSIPHKPPCCTHQINCKSFNYNSWDNILNKIVKQTGYMRGINSTLIDYKSFQNNQTLNTMFSQFINEISVFDVSTLNCSQQYAFYINIYNAFAIKMILDHTNKDGSFVNSITDITEYIGLRSVWKMTAGKIGGVDYTLDNVEQNTLRKYWNDSRIHSCLYCGALSCPDLINSAYDPNIIESQLLSSFRMWMNNTSKGMNINGNTLYLNMIYGWYQDTDFKPNIKTFLIKYIKSNVTKQLIQNANHIQYLHYNWDLNIFTKT